MKKIVISLAVLGLVAMSASALQIHSEDGTLPYTWSFVNNAGDVNLDGYVEGKSKVGMKFDSFCIEKNEYFTPDGTYFVETPLDMSADKGGVGATAHGDPVSVGTAWLYSNFARGQLTGYVYGSYLSANELQNAIWMLEGEIDVNAGNAFYSLASSTLGTSVLTTDAVDGQYGVWAMNLWTARESNGNGGYSYSGYVQDQLYYRTPDGGLTIALVGLALGGLAVLRRRM
jgi:hypothetical protein